MIDSRDLDDLHEALYDRFMLFKSRAESEIAGLKIIVSCTFRDAEVQAKLYAQGRTTPGRIVTNAKPGESNHNKTNTDGYPRSRAVDIFPLRYGKSVMATKEGDEVTDPLWQLLGRIGQDCGLVWGGTFKSFPEGPHFELPKDIA